MLNDYNFLTSYNKLENDIAEEFYLPCMKTAIQYDRISGYFSSTIYIIAWDALKDFISNGGKMRIVCSPYVSKEDADALSEGYSARSDSILSSALEREVKEMFESDDLAVPAKLLAYLVAKEIVNIQIAIPSENQSALTKRMFHDKVGIFTDANGNSVGFRGSMNETFQGLSSDGNIESIDVFPSWLDERDRNRFKEAGDFFEKLWRHDLPGVVVYQFPKAARKILEQKSNDVHWEELLKEIQTNENDAKKWKPNHKRNGKIPLEHQTKALNAWVEHGRRGIFEHATGSGKTFTAICAINAALNQNEVILVLVPSRDLLKQWEFELHETLTDQEIFYLLCGDNNIEWKKNNALKAWTSYRQESKRIIIATMDTACSDAFLSGISQGDHIFLIADEMHRLGSKQRRKILNIQTGARLGLSATPYRYGDPEGTTALFDYFGGIIPPPFTLEDAIKSGVLTKYFYHPQKIKLSSMEQENWNSITKEIQQVIARMKIEDNPKINIDANPKLKQLLIKRSRIVKNASGKIPLALKILKNEYKPGEKWIVYCDNIKQLKAILNQALDAGIDAYEYYADMKGNRDTTLKYFSKNGGVLVSVKCLDEGVDIPNTTHALILASSQNPREFIQRRGRILRKAPGKLFAHLYDAITVPEKEDQGNDKSLSIISAELSRAIQFGENAENPACITDLKSIALDFHIDFERLKDGGIEYDNE